MVGTVGTIAVPTFVFELQKSANKNILIYYQLGLSDKEMFITPFYLIVNVCQIKGREWDDEVTIETKMICAIFSFMLCADNYDMRYDKRIIYFGLFCHPLKIR